MAGEGPDASFRRFLADGQLMIQRRRVSEEAVFPPRLMAPGDGATDLEWVSATGRATVHSFTVVARKPPLDGYNICLVDLEEGPRLMSRLVDIANDDIAIGLAVEAVIDRDGDAPVLLFRPAAA